MFKPVTSILGFLALLAGLLPPLDGVRAQPEPLRIYIDADFSITPAPAQAIEVGLRSAFAGTWAETGIEIVPRDHRNNARRSWQTMQTAMRDPTALAVVGGMHSPPYLLNGTRINAENMLLFLPWSAGGVLTRLANGEENWIFRVSIDDTKAATKLARFAARSGCDRAAILFVSNPWGQGNAARLVREIEEQDLALATMQSLPFNAGQQIVVNAMQEVQVSGADCVILVAGLMLGKSVITAVAELPNAPRIISHWGILGDRLTAHIPTHVLDRVNLAILGTCGFDKAANHPEVYARARDMAKRVTGRAFDPASHPAPHGFFHAYDLGLLLIGAIENARYSSQWRGAPEARRAALRDALYAQASPIEGLLKFYVSPFSPVNRLNPDGHEALNAQDLCMTGVDHAGNIVGLTGE